MYLAARRSKISGPNSFSRSIAGVQYLLRSLVNGRQFRRIEIRAGIDRFAAGAEAAAVEVLGASRFSC